MASDPDPMGPRLERALRWASIRHDGQHRKASPVPYVQHPMAVAWILDRLGFDEDVVIAGLLHDVVEDTGASLDDVRQRFGDRVAALVGHCTERKLDDEGRPRPWADRKREHLEHLEASPIEARAIALADLLHNMRSIADDLADGQEVWGRFNAGRDQIIGRYRASLDRLNRDGDARLGDLVLLGREALSDLEGGPSVDESSGTQRFPGPADPIG